MSPQIPTVLFLCFLIILAVNYTKKEQLCFHYSSLVSFLVFHLLSFSKLLPPPPSPFHEASVLCLPKLDWRPLYPLLSLANPDHMVKEWAALLRYPPSSGCSHGITLQLQWERSTGRESVRGRDREPKMDMANLFKHFFREFPTSLVSYSCLKCCSARDVVSLCLKFSL